MDVLVGGLGNDMLIGGADDDTLIGDIQSGAGNDVLYGGDGTDWLSGNAGNDYLDGGKGTDKLSGGDGDDYLYGGDDTERDELNGGNNNDTMVMGINDIAGGGSGNDIYIWDTHQVTTTPTHPAANTANSNTSSNSFADIAVPAQNAQQFQGGLIIDSEGNDTLALVGISNLDALDFNVRADNLYLNTGSLQMIIQGGASNAAMQIVTGTSVEQIASSTISFKALTDDTFLNGSDLLAQPQVNTAGLLLGRAQNTLATIATTANTYLAGGLVNDRLTANIGGTKFIGGRGDDTFKGDIGNDTYLIRAGDGNDIITEKGGSNTIKLDKNISEQLMTTPLSARHVGADLLIKISDEQSITVKNMFDATTGALIDANSIQQIKFYDNTTWDIAKIKQQALISTNGDDVYQYALRNPHIAENIDFSNRA